jgi:DNA-binding transcriptional LysR family regulator
MQSLRLFCDVAALRSFSKAADLHGITQSAVSQRVRQLEERLGVELLDRSVRPPALTAAGELFAREARELVDRYDDLTRRVAAMNGAPDAAALEGEVVVAAIYSAGIDLLQTLQERFEETHPRVEIRIDYKRPEEVDRAVRQGTCDFGIVSYPRQWRGLAVRPLRDERMSVVCPPHHRLAVRREVRAADLAGMPMLGFDAQLPVARHIRRYLRSHGVEIETVQEVDNIDTLKSLLEHSDEFAILPRRTVRREAEDGTLVVVELEPELIRPLGIISARKARLGPAAQTFQDFLVEHADPDARRAPTGAASLSVAM